MLVHNVEMTRRWVGLSLVMGLASFSGFGQTTQTTISLTLSGKGSGQGRPSDGAGRNRLYGEHAPGDRG